MQTRNRPWLFIILVVMLAALPRATSAAICFTDGVAKVVIEIAATGGPFYSLVGEFILGSTSTPLMANAHLRSTGVAHIAGTLPAHPSGSNSAFTFAGTLNPPSYNTGSWTFQRLTGTEDAFTVTWTAVTCPPLPEGPASPALSSSPWKE